MEQSMDRDRKHIEGMSSDEVAEYLQTKLVEELHDKAELILNDYWMVQHRRKQGDGVDQAYGVIGCRIVPGKRTFRVEWFRRKIRFARGAEKEVSTGFDRLPVKNNRLSMKSIGKVEPWELEAIAKADAEFEKIRNCMEHVKKVNYAVRGIKAQMEMMESKYDEEEIDA